MEFDVGSLLSLPSKSRLFELSFRCCRRFLFERFFLLEFDPFNNSVLLPSMGIVVHQSRRNLINVFFSDLCFVFLFNDEKKTKTNIFYFSLSHDLVE